MLVEIFQSALLDVKGELLDTALVSFRPNQRWPSSPIRARL